MKTTWSIVTLSLATGLQMQAQNDRQGAQGRAQSSGSPYAVAERSAHQTRWQRLEWQTDRVGRAVAQTNSFVTLATGLNFFNETTRQWESSREEWQVYADGIVAQTGRHKVILAKGNLNLGGCVEVDVLTPDGVRLTCAPVSLGFFDPVDGKQVVVAEVKANCSPERGATPNEILFRDCFDRVRGSIRFPHTWHGELGEGCSMA